MIRLSSFVLNFMCKVKYFLINLVNRDVVIYMLCRLDLEIGMLVVILMVVFRSKMVVVVLILW